MAVCEIRWGGTIVSDFNNGTIVWGYGVVLGRQRD